MKTKHLLSGVAVIAALALSAPAWAQPANPSGGNAMGVQTCRVPDFLVVPSYLGDLIAWSREARRCA
jgi:hypothetical protein